MSFSSSSYIMYNEYSHTSPIHTFIHPWHQYFHMYIHNIFIHNINSYTFALVVQNIVFNRVLPVRVLLVIVSSPKFLQRNILHLPSCHQKCHPQCVWSRDVTHYKPDGFRQIFYEAQWILANSYETFYQKPSGFSQTSYQKPSGFSQTLSKAEWILANLL